MIPRAVDQRRTTSRLAWAGLLCAVLAGASACSSRPPPGVVRLGLASAAANASLARWSPLIPLPLIPVAAANLPDGKVLFWAADDRFNFGIGSGWTYTAILDPQTGGVTERTVSETGHDMFCPGTAYLADGRILVNGGFSAGATSLFDPATGAWTKGALMNIPRAYEGTTLLADGSVLTLGGSWAGGVGNKHGERWTDATGWRRLPGVPIDPFLSVDTTRDFGADSHLWLFAAGNGRVLHPGPGVDMHWIDTTGDGLVTRIGPRGDDQFSINGDAVMYDVGKILKVGGAAGYEHTPANTNAYVIEVGGDVKVRKIAPLAYPRAFANAVALPNGQVVVVGGMTVANSFTDSNGVLVPELFDPATETFALLPPIAVARNYHSLALLLPDGRVLSGGGGLCGDGCPANHPDVQLLSPPYLFNADGSPAARPTILTAPAAANHGTSMTVTTDGPIASFALMRLAAVTHTISNDQRRLPLVFRETATDVYAVDVPSNPGWALPGLYMLFALSPAGVPSVAALVHIGSTTVLRLAPVPDQSTLPGTAARVALQATGAGPGTLTYAAAGLPPGLSVDPSTGVIAGAPSAVGTYLVEAAVADGAQTVSTQFAWTVGDTSSPPPTPTPPPAPAATTRYVMLEADSEVNGNPWTSAAEINLLGDGGQTLPRAGWTISADSAEVSGENGAAANAVDGNTVTYWHTKWLGGSPGPPHWFKIDLGAEAVVTGLRYLPRPPGNINGTIAQYRIYVSHDGINWGAPVAQGTFAGSGAVSDEKTVRFVAPAPALPLVVAPVIAPIAGSGAAVALTAAASGTAPLAYSWTFGDGGASTGFSSSPTITHVFARPGVYTATLTVQAGDGKVDAQSFLQGVAAPGAVGTPRASGGLAVEGVATGGGRVWVVNADSDIVSVFDAATQTKLREIPVGAAPRTLALAPTGSAWVTNQGAATVSVIDPTSLTVTRTIALPRASQPFGVVVAGDGSAFVTLEATSTLIKLDDSGAVVATLDVGPHPRHLALTAAGDRLLVSRFITAPQPGEDTADVQTSVDGVKQGGEVLIVNPATLTLTTRVVVQHSEKVDSPVSARGVPNYLGAPAIAPDDASAWVPSKQDNIQRGRLRDGRDLDFQSTVRAISSRIDLTTQAEDAAARIDHDNAGMASAAAFHPLGVYLFVALPSARQLAVVDAAGARELFRVDTGRAPQAVTVSRDGTTLYVHNTLDRTVGIYDLAPLGRGQPTLPLRATLATVATEPLAPAVLRGKQLFYDARDTRLGRDAYLSCAACHDDGGQDGRTWDFTSLGEGLRNTIDLRGRAGGQGRLHWSANFDEVQDFEGQLRGLGQGTGLMSDVDFMTGTRNQPLGDPKANVSADLDALAAYVQSLATFAPSPYRDPAGALTAAALAGRGVFAARCLPCHGQDAFTDSASLEVHDVGTLKPSSGTRLFGPLTGIDTPTLRDVWATAPYLHDGSAPTLAAAISAHTGLSPPLSAETLANLAAFVQQIGGQEPAVAPAPATGGL
ncbi:MAG TPA: galactose oxidase-like domain-containing protein, partial [Polyangia bacterium]|nr:galactose oxidase-like domain-containing protein [Polyangia bacterium]